MSKSHRAPKQNYTTGCSSALLIVIPVAIYLLQLFGKVSAPATIVAGALVFVKALIEWQHNRRHRSVPNHVSSENLPLVRRTQAPIAAAVAGCYLCKELHPLRPYHMAGYRIGICQRCYACVLHTEQRI